MAGSEFPSRGESRGAGEGGVKGPEEEEFEVRFFLELDFLICRGSNWRFVGWVCWEIDRLE